jgi:hypothetical protein
MNSFSDAVLERAVDNQTRGGVRRSKCAKQVMTISAILKPFCCGAPLSKTFNRKLP